MLMAVMGIGFLQQQTSRLSNKSQGIFPLVSKRAYEASPITNPKNGAYMSGKRVRHVMCIMGFVDKSYSKPKRN